MRADGAWALPPASVNTTARSYLAGLTLSNDSTTPNSVLDIAAGMAADSTNVEYINIGAFTKSTAGAWTSGSGNNGMGNGLTIANSTWYHVCLANNSGTADIWFDTSASCANRPGGISDTAFRRIGSFKTDSSAHILTFTQNGDEFIWKTALVDANNVTLSGSAISKTLTVPTGVEVWAKFTALLQASGSGDILFYPLDMGTQAAGTPAGYTSLAPLANGASNAADFAIRTNTSAQIGVVGNGTAGAYYMDTYGWIDRRGRDN